MAELFLLSRCCEVFANSTFDIVILLGIAKYNASFRISRELWWDIDSYAEDVGMTKIEAMRRTITIAKNMLAVNKKRITPPFLTMDYSQGFILIRKKEVFIVYDSFYNYGGSHNMENPNVNVVSLVDSPLFDVYPAVIFKLEKST